MWMKGELLVDNFLGLTVINQRFTFNSPLIHRSFTAEFFKQFQSEITPFLLFQALF